MKDGLRFVDSDMHVQEPGDLFERYLDPAFQSRITSVVGADGRPRRGGWIIDGLPASQDVELQQHRKRGRPGASAGPVLGSATGQLSATGQATHDARTEGKVRRAYGVPGHRCRRACAG